VKWSAATSEKRKFVTARGWKNCTREGVGNKLIHFVGKRRDFTATAAGGRRKERTTLLRRGEEKKRHKHLG